MSSRRTRPWRWRATDRQRSATDVADHPGWQAGAIVTSDDGKVHYGVARVEVYLPGLDSLKAKRTLVRKMQAALQRELSCSVAEVGGQDLWQRAVLGVAVAASSATGVDRVLDRISAIIERDPRVEVLAVSDLADHLDPDLGDRPTV